MTSATRYSSERNGYKVEVYEYTVNRKHGFGTRVTNMTTQNSLQTPGFATYGTALMVAQQEAEEAKI
jgi:hypothetical protein